MRRTDFVPITFVPTTLNENVMDQNEGISQLEEMFSEMLQRQDRMNEDNQKMRTSQLQHMQMSIRQSDNISYLLENQVSKKEFLELKEEVSAKFDMLLKAINELKK